MLLHRDKLSTLQKFCTQSRRKQLPLKNKCAVLNKQLLDQQQTLPASKEPFAQDGLLLVRPERLMPPVRPSVTDGGG
jgi:hypothetical protein